MTESVVSRIIGNLATGSFGRVVGALTPLLLVPFMIRTWGIDIYGEWLILTAIPAYIMLAPDFGLAGAVVNRMAYLTAEGSREEAVYIYRSAFVALIIASSSFVSLGWLIAWLIDWSQLGVRSITSTESTAIIGLSCVQVLIAQQCFLLSGIYRSAQRNPRFGLLQSINQFIVLLISLLVLWSGSGPLQVVFARLVTYMLFLLVLFIDSRKLSPGFSLSFNGVSYLRIKPYIVPGLGHAGMPLINALQNQGVLLVIGALLGSTSVGIFQTIRVLSNSIKSILSLLSSSIMVEIPSLLGQNRKALVEGFLIRNTQVGVFLTTGMIMVFLFFGEPIYHLWLGNQLPYYSEIVLLMLLSLIPNTLAQSFSILLLSCNKIHLTIIPLTIVAASSVGCLSILLHVYDLRGAACGIILWEALIAGVFLKFVHNNNLIRAGYFKRCFNCKLFISDIKMILARLRKNFSLDK